MRARATALGCFAFLVWPGGPAAAQAAAQPSADEKLVIAAEVRRQVARCWVPPLVIFGVLPQVHVTFALKRDGSLDGPPQVIIDLGRGVTREHAAAAVEAVQVCAPYTLPERHFGFWRRITINFAQGFAPPSPQ